MKVVIRTLPSNPLLSCAGWVRRSLLLIVLSMAGGCDPKTALEHLSDAQAKVEAGEHRVAIIELKNALQKDPQLAEARALLGMLHYRNGDMLSAHKELERAVTLGDSTDDTRLHLLRTKLQLDRHAEVIEELSTQPNLQPAYAVELGNAYLLANDLNSARPLFEQGADLATGLFGLAQVAYYQDELAESLQFVERAVQSDAAFTDAWLFKAELELMDDAEAALVSYQAAANQPDGQILGSMGMVEAHLALEDLARASEEVTKLVNLAPWYYWAQYFHGLVRFLEGDLEAAEEAIRLGQQYYPEHLPSMYMLALVKAGQAQSNQAVDSLRRYVRQDEEFLSARKLLAALHIKEGQFDEVIEVLDPIVLNYRDPQVWALLGQAHSRLGNAIEAFEATREAASISSDPSLFQNQLQLELLHAGAFAATTIEVAGDLFGHYISPVLALSAGDGANASAAAQELLKDSEDDLLGLTILGESALMMDDLDTAEFSLDKALAVDPSFFPATAALAQLALKKGKSKKARSILEQAASENPGIEEAGLGLIDHLVNQSDVDGAFEHLEQMVGRDPKSVRPRLKQLQLQLETHRIGEAHHSAKLLLEQAPEVLDVLLLSARVSLASRNQTKASNLLGELMALYGRYASDVHTVAEVGRLLLQARYLDEAKDFIDTALALDNSLAKAKLHRAHLDVLEGNVAAADAQLTTLAGDDVDAQYLELVKGEILAAKGDLKGATRLYRKLARRGSREGTVQYAMAAAQARNYRQAERELKRWLSKHPGDMGMRMLLADIGLESKEPGLARQQYEKLLPSEDPVLLNNLAWIYMQQGDERAEETARSANALLPSSPDIADTLGWILVRNGAAEEALSYLQSSANERPDDPSIQYHLGVALNDTGREEEAIEALERALNVEYDFADRSKAEQLLETLAAN